MAKETKEEIKETIERRRARFDDSELVMINKIRFLIEQLPTPESRLRAVQYLSSRFNPEGKGAPGGRGVSAVIPSGPVFD